MSARNIAQKTKNRKRSCLRFWDVVMGARGIDLGLLLDCVVGSSRFERLICPTAVVPLCRWDLYLLFYNGRAPIRTGGLFDVNEAL